MSHEECSKAMVSKGELHLGAHVLFGDERLGGVVDGLCQDWVGIRLDKGGYVIAEWKDVYRKEES